jgi:hypothetical protein
MGELLGPRAGDDAAERWEIYLGSDGIEPRSECYIFKDWELPFTLVLLPHYMLHAHGIWWRQREFQRSITVIVIRDDNSRQLYDGPTFPWRWYRRCDLFPVLSSIDGRLHWSRGCEAVHLFSHSFVHLPAIGFLSSKQLKEGCVTVRRGMDWIGFTAHLYTALATTRNYSGTADFHTLQLTVTPTSVLSLLQPPLADSWQRILTQKL